MKNTTLENGYLGILSGGIHDTRPAREIARVLLMREPHCGLSGAREVFVQHRSRHFSTKMICPEKLAVWWRILCEAARTLYFPGETPIRVIAEILQPRGQRIKRSPFAVSPLRVHPLPIFHRGPELLRFEPRQILELHQPHGLDAFFVQCETEVMVVHNIIALPGSAHCREPVLF